MKFNICLLESSIHTQCFLEIAGSIEWALKDLGHEVERVRSVMPLAQALGADPAIERTIVFGARPDDVRDFPSSVIFYNGEQVSSDSMWVQLAPLYKRFTVWDYSAANADRYEAWGLKRPEVVRQGYAPVLDGIVPEVKKTHDVVFFGSLNARRDKVLQNLQVEGISVLQVPFGLYGAERNAIIAQAKLCLNIHYYDNGIFEAIRCAPLCQNGMPVVTEASVDFEENFWGLLGVPYERLVVAVQRLIASPEALAAACEMQRDYAKSVSLLRDVEKAVSNLESVEQSSRSLVVQEQEVIVSDGQERVVDSNGVMAGITGQFPELTLSMIVKNEADVIERCLRSVKPYLKQWCIIDTGSTDGTQEIARRVMGDLPGGIFDSPWKEFDGSRTEAIDKAREICGGRGWFLLIDADEVFTLDGDLELSEEYGCYHGWFTRGQGSSRWERPLFLRANRPYFYEMPRHEGIYCRVHSPTSPRVIQNAVTLSTFEGARAKEGMTERYTRDAQVLEKWLLSHPGHTRCQYYIAQSYRDAATGTVPFDRNLMQKAVMHYLKRAQMPGGYDQETFSAMYQAGQAMVKLDYPWERCQHQFMAAWNAMPTRAEPIYNIARYYREQQKYPLAELFARRAATVPLRHDGSADYDTDVHVWRAKEELSVALTYLKGHAEARDIMLEIIDHLPPTDRARVQENLDMCIREAGPKPP